MPWATVVDNVYLPLKLSSLTIAVPPAPASRLCTHPHDQ
jgi:hypothetical protein